MMAGVTAITVERLTKRFGRTVAVDGVDLAIASGEIFFLLGPSGCGKTTLLRAIAGFVAPDAGLLRFDGRDVTTVQARRRGTAMVFQSYALWPHMTVRQNVAYGLKLRRVAPPDRQRRVDEALRLVRLDEQADRRPGELSGGQQQRVALARALVVEPAVLLLDEPLSNLDARLRAEMRGEIRRICRASRITTVYVTHDQAEALSMADRVAVMRAGRIEQVGTPRAIYTRPCNRFVADFLGDANFLPVLAVEPAPDGGAIIVTAAGRLPGAPTSTSAPGRREPEGPLTCCIRPEAFTLLGGDGGPDGPWLRGRLVDTQYFGHLARHEVELDGAAGRVHAIEINPGGKSEPGRPVRLQVEADDVVVMSE